MPLPHFLVCWFPCFSPTRLWFLSLHSSIAQHFLTLTLYSCLWFCISLPLPFVSFSLSVIIFFSLLFSLFLYINFLYTLFFYLPSAPFIFLLFFSNFFLSLSLLLLSCYKSSLLFSYSLSFQDFSWFNSLIFSFYLFSSFSILGFYPPFHLSLSVSFILLYYYYLFL